MEQKKAKNQNNEGINSTKKFSPRTFHSSLQTRKDYEYEINYKNIFTVFRIDIAWLWLFIIKLSENYIFL